VWPRVEFIASPSLSTIGVVRTCCLVTDACPRRLRWDKTGTPLVSWTRTCNFGDRALACTAGPRVWNYLPTNLNCILPFQTVAEDIFIWSMRPKRRVNSVNPFKLRFRDPLIYIIAYIYCLVNGWQCRFELNDLMLSCRHRPFITQKQSHAVKL